jgi:hypothetical protein
MKAAAQIMSVEDKSMHQIFQQGPDGDASNHEVEAIQASQVHKNQNGKRHGDEVAKVSNSSHRLGRRAGNSSSSHGIVSSADSSGLSGIVDLRAKDQNRFI